MGAETDRTKCIKIGPGEKNDLFFLTGLCPVYKESVKTDVSTGRQGQAYNRKASPEGLPSGAPRVRNGCGP